MKTFVSFLLASMLVAPALAQGVKPSALPAASSPPGGVIVACSVPTTTGGVTTYASKACTLDQINARASQRATLQRIVDKMIAASASNPIDNAVDTGTTVVDASGGASLTNGQAYYQSAGVYATQYRVTGGVPTCGLYTDGTTNFCRFISASTPSSDNIASASVAPFAVTGRANTFNVSFRGEGAKYQIAIVGSGNGSVRCVDNGKFAQSATPINLGGNGTRTITLQVGDGTATNRGWRNWSCDFSGPVGLVGVYTDVASTITAPPDNDSVYVFGNGDSYVAGSYGSGPNPNYSMSGFVSMFGKLGDFVVQNNALGGTGYTNINTTYNTCGQRIAADLPSARADMIINACLYNDISMNAATEAAAATAAWTAERALKPYSLIVVLGAYTPPSATLSTAQTAEDNLLTAFNAWVAASGEKNALFVPIARATPRYQTGTGTTTATTGDGNSDYYINGADTTKTHPIEAGYINIGRRLLIDIRNGAAKLLTGTIGPIS